MILCNALAFFWLFFLPSALHMYLKGHLLLCCICMVMMRPLFFTWFGGFPIFFTVTGRVWEASSCISCASMPLLLVDFTTTVGHELLWMVISIVLTDFFVSEKKAFFLYALSVFWSHMLLLLSLIAFVILYIFSLPFGLHEMRHILVWAVSTLL